MKKKITITVDEDVLVKLQEIAQLEGRSISSLLNKISKDFILGKK